jgi:hypothetical protein
MEDELIDALGDTPETVIPCHQLLRGLARCRVAGNLPDFDAAVVQAIDNPKEPSGFGRVPAALWRLLRDLWGWECISVTAALAEPLRRLIECERGAPVRLYGDVYHVLTRTAAVYQHPWVRQLTVADLPLIAAAPHPVANAEDGSVGLEDVARQQSSAAARIR